MLSAYTLIFAIVNARQEIGADAAEDENERPNEKGAGDQRRARQPVSDRLNKGIETRRAT
jgi:hypothetical protein